MLIGPVPVLMFYADARALFERGMVQHKTGDLEGAQRSLTSALEADPKNFAIAANLGVVQAQLGQYADAIASYRLALTLNPKASRLRLNMGIAFFKQSLFAEAVEQLEAFRKVQASDPQAQELLALSYIQVQRNAEAVTILDELVRAYGEKLPYLYALGQAQMRAGVRDAGEMTLQRMFALYPDSPETHMLRAQASMASNEYEAAYTSLQSAAKANASLPGLHLWKGIALEGLGKPEEARAEYQREIGATGDLLAYYAAGILEFKTGTPEAALMLLQPALPIDSESYNVSFYLARTLVKLKRYEEALTAAKRSLTRNPKSVPDHVVLLSIYRALGRTEDVKKEGVIIRELQNASVEKDRESVEKLNSRPSLEPR